MSFTVTGGTPVVDAAGPAAFTAPSHSAGGLLIVLWLKMLSGGVTNPTTGTLVTDGWTVLGNYPGSSADCHVGAAWKIGDGSESSSVTAMGSNNRTKCYAIAGADTSVAPTIATAADTDSDLSIAAPSGLAAGRLLIGIAAFNGSFSALTIDNGCTIDDTFTGVGCTYYGEATSAGATLVDWTTNRTSRGLIIAVAPAATAGRGGLAGALHRPLQGALT